MRKGIFFSLDAIFALTIISVGLVLIVTSYVSERPVSHQISVSEDVINVLSELRIHEIDNAYVAAHIANGTIKGSAINNSVLEQAAQFWAANQSQWGVELIQNVTLQLFPGLDDFNVIVGGEEIYNLTTGDKTLVIPIRKVISGIAKDKVTKGVSVRPFLTSISSKKTSQFLYFGGFVGQGNLSRSIDTIPADAQITSMEMELDAGGDFNLTINGIPCQNIFTASPGNFSAERWDISGCNQSILNGSGLTNNFALEFTGGINDSYVGGGFFKISYTTSELVEFSSSATKRFRLPYINGIVNYFSGFMVPGTLISMDGYLHYYVDAAVIDNISSRMLIGNITVYSQGQSSYDEAFTFTDANLSGLLNYTFLSNSTVPLRFIVGNLSLGEIISITNGTVHAALTTDVSGSMDWEMGSGSSGTARDCDDPNINNSDTQRLSVAKCVNKNFVSSIITSNSSENQVGLVSYETATDEIDDLTNNVTFLEAEIDAYSPLSATCISCGIFNSTDMLIKSFMQLSTGEWQYSAAYQSSSPPSGWETNGYDDSNWSTGTSPLGTGSVNTSVVLNSAVELWELYQDAPQPVDFTTGLNSTDNTYGFQSGGSIIQALNNAEFTGPSIGSWSQSGTVNTSDTGGLVPGAPVLMFTEDWENNSLTQQFTQFGDTDWRIDNDRPIGSYIAEGRDCDSPCTLNVSTPIDLSGQTDCNLSFWWRRDDIESGETSGLDIYDGSWNINAWSWDDTEDDDVLYFFSLDLDENWSMTSDFMFRFTHDASHNGDEFWQDNINVTCAGSAVAGPLTGFGLDDFWYVDSNESTFGSLNQSFTSPSANPTSAILSFYHSTNDTIFDGTADPFCNITHPGGTDTVWSDSWNSASNPVGPTQVNVDITGEITSDSFDYMLECGTEISGGSGRTVVAFDNITVTINYDINSDDGWDWEAGVFDNASNEEVQFGDPSGLSNYSSSGRIEVKLGGEGTTVNPGPESGGWGVQFNVTQNVVDMATNGTSVILSFTYSTEDIDGDLEEGVWIKGRLTQSNGTVVWLGSDLESDDSTPEIWSETGSHDSGFTEVTNQLYQQDIGSYLTQPGWYYLELGGKIESTNFGGEGFIAAFDNVDISFNNSVGNIYFRNHFNITDTSSLHNYRLFVSSDDEAEVYVNGNLVSNDTSGPHAAKIWNVLNVSPADSYFQNGENVIAAKVRNDDTSVEFDLELWGDTTDAVKALLIMSDGDANRCHGPDDGRMDQNGLSGSCGDSTAESEAINFSCWAHQAYGIRIYSVGFGPSADASALNQSACCDNCSNYYQGDNASALYDIYDDIAQAILAGTITLESQILQASGNVTGSILYDDSYLDITYTPPLIDQTGVIAISQESGKFQGCTHTEYIEPEFTVVDARVASYSSQHWTDQLIVNNQVVYNLTDHSSNYSLLGDPFEIYVPGYLIVGGNNTFQLRTGDSPGNATGCSQNNSLIYTALINLSVPYGGVYETSNGCNWTVEFEDNTTKTLEVPSSPSPTSTCNYTNASIVYNGGDAYDVGVNELLDQLDFNDDGRVDVLFTEDDFNIEANSITEVPSLWGPTVAEVRSWQ